jgi:hypothetical protein
VLRAGEFSSRRYQQDRRRITRHSTETYRCGDVATAAARHAERWRASTPLEAGPTRQRPARDTDASQINASVSGMAPEYFEV